MVFNGTLTKKENDKSTKQQKAAYTWPKGNTCGVLQTFWKPKNASTDVLLVQTVDMANPHIKSSEH